MQQKHQPISRKFRPQLFSDVVGQNAIITTLKNALRLKKLAHAYLFCGTRGTGKTTLARIFAKALNCLTPVGSEPCNACSSCREILSGHSLDVIEIDGASNRGIDDIRTINDTVGYAASGGSYKIYIIDEVHMLTKEAFNALLKTLEEPPEKVKFFFATTEAHKLPATILSRCQRFDLLRIPDSLIVEKLKEIQKSLARSSEEEALFRIAAFAEGSLRDAESLLDQVFCYEEKEITLETVNQALGLIPSSFFFALDKAFSEGDLSHAFLLAERIYLAGKDFTYFLEQLAEHFHTLIRMKLHRQSHLNASYTEAVLLYTEGELIFILDLLTDGMQKIQRSSCKRIEAEMLLLTLLRSKNRIPIETIARRLIELEKTAAAQLSKETSSEQVPCPDPSDDRIVLKPIPFMEARQAPPPGEMKENKPPHSFNGMGASEAPPPTEMNAATDNQPPHSFGEMQASQALPPSELKAATEVQPLHSFSGMGASQTLSPSEMKAATEAQPLHSFGEMPASQVLSPSELKAATEAQPPHSFGEMQASQALSPSELKAATKAQPPHSFGEMQASQALPPSELKATTKAQPPHSFGEMQASQALSPSELKAATKAQPLHSFGEMQASQAPSPSEMEAATEVQPPHSFGEMQASQALFPSELKAATEAQPLHSFGEMPASQALSPSELKAATEAQPPHSFSGMGASQAPPPKKKEYYETLLRFAAVELEGTLKKGDLHG